MDECMELYRECDEIMALIDMSQEELDKIWGIKRYKPITDHGFPFYPSYRKTYLTLKEGDPEVAIRYLEALMAYGTDFTEPDPTDLLTCALLYGPMKTIDKSFDNYMSRVSKVARERKRLEEEAARRIREQERLEEEIRREEQEEPETDSFDGENA